ncbi:MAG: glycogen synthase [Calditrichaeota bacterium]|nr:MAG: glycogen synthase [Calditrichota bacterium]
MENFKILYLASEVAPFAKAGGLADVTSALPKALKGLNQEIRLMMPKYKFINDRKYILREVIRLREIKVTIGGVTKIANVKSAFLPESKVQIYFIEIEDLFNRLGIYNDPKTKEPYPDNAIRFAYFSKAALETLKILSWQPNIIHCNDWQSAFVPVYLKTVYMNDPFFKGVKSVFTIHNLTSTGSFPKETAKEIDFDESQTKEGGMFNKDGELNLTKGAIYFSDFLTTVSENYANEIIANDETGFGFGTILDEKGEKFEGILNGVDYGIWSPEKDKLLPHQYSTEDMNGKLENKKTLLNRLGLKFDEKTPLLSMIANIEYQKGFDLVLEAMEELLKEQLQICILGDGDREITKELYKFTKSHPGQFSMNITFDDKMSHLVEAGSDLFLMPSRYEPCGLHQIYSLRYGTIPIVSKIGGLYDTVDEIDLESGEGTGFLIEELNAKSLVKTVKKSIELFKDTEKWDKIRQHIMLEDFSWEYSAKRYLDIYNRVINE